MEYKLYSHPNTLLKDHLHLVTKIGMARFLQNNIFMEYEALMRVILAFHDLGKASSYFQGYLLRSEPRSKLTRHSEFSSIWAYLYCSEVLQYDDFECLAAKICVGSHHKDLANMDDTLIADLENEDLKQISEAIDYPEINRILHDLGLQTELSASLFSSFFELPPAHKVSRRMRKVKRSLSLKHWLVLNYLFSILIWADKYAAIFEQKPAELEGNIWQTQYLDAFVNKLPAKDNVIGRIRSRAYQELSQNLDVATSLYSVNLPTGAGKTISSLKVAIELRQLRPELQRIIYCLPFTAIIDQNQKVFENILQTSGIDPKPEYILAHHHLAEPAFKKAGKYSIKNGDEYSEDEAIYLVETWDSELIVTTFVQAMASFLSVKNSSLKRFHRLANSIFILDEVQNIPHYYWYFLKGVLKELSEQLNCVIILVTATLPMILDASDGMKELATRKDEWFGALNRISLDTSNFGHGLKNTIELEDLSKAILTDIEENDKLNRLIILNTIQSSLDLYELLKDSGEVPESKLLYISSNVIPLQRLQMIRQIKENPGQGLIIVSTQVVEAGVDIDVNVVYRDLAPLDSIIQASGRCNRNDSKQQSTVKIFRLAKNGKAYWSYIYDKTLVHTTLAILEEYPALIPESQIAELTEKYYHRLNEVTSKDTSRCLLNWLTNLGLSKALNYHPKEYPDAFHLIDDRDMQVVFIEYDERARELSEEYHGYLKDEMSDPFERRGKLKDVLRRMGPYMINVQRKLLKTEDPIFRVGNSEMQLYYDLKTGFKREDKQEDYIF